ncbi:retropepsin-like aspartic protease [Chitinophaga sp. Cy-1792]|uniref:retropepsin-like aspartic protease n=1 Tax=Chitinophaga sp. Cy-1792 TaxID=2608339 RepID=UPI0014232A3E|nr:retropepsin-like aspartic protease [Chitinophaga sp. Cy-1792]NIG55456.1 hypothetical protein [Chitinophaga sp. Cy-1792]
MLRTISISFFLLLFLLAKEGSAQTNSAAFQDIYQLIKTKNFFKAKEVFDNNKDLLNKDQLLFASAVLDNAFNKLDHSNQTIRQLTAAPNTLPDSLQLQLYKTEEDNLVKLYDYKGAKYAVENILQRCGKLLSADEKEDLANDLKIWSALQNIGRQRVSIKGDNHLKMTKDKAGLNNLEVATANDTMSFIFDTGANMSTISRSAATQLKMQLIPTDITVLSITGNQVTAQLAVCDSLKLGHISFYNVVFLVLADEGLTFPQISYQIQGILGFPVIEALKEIQITKDGYFNVPRQETKIDAPSNMAMFGLTPLIYVDDMHFTFDTGAESTMLYDNFYQKYKKDIDGHYRRTKISFGGAGGKVVVGGYKIDHTFNILNKAVELKQVSLLRKNLPPMGVYGNIGQDVIRQFDKMTLNFDKMFIKFD